LQIRNDEHKPDYSNQGGKILAAIPQLKEVSFGLQMVFAPDLPDLRQDEKRNHSPQRLISQNVQGRPAFRIRPAAGSEKRESGIDLARHQQPNQD